jgi:hypothetical protein
VTGPATGGVNGPVTGGVNGLVNDGVNRPVNDGVNGLVNDGVNRPVNDGVNRLVNDGVNGLVNDGVNGGAAGGGNGLAADRELRALVREVLRDVLPTLAGTAGNGTASPRAAAPSAAPHSPAPASTLPSPAPASTPPSPAPASTPPSSVPATTPPSSVPATSPAPPAPSVTAEDDYASVRAVRLTTDEELHAFVLQVLRLADNPKRRRDLLARRLRFTLAGAGPAPGPAVTHRVDKGAVTERAVIAAASAGAGLVLGPRAVMTPLARDKARALGVRVEKER